MSNKIFVLYGFSGSGKDTILNELLNRKLDIKPIISYSSRPIRENETQGIDYNFITKEQFISSIKNDDMLEHRAYNIDYEGVKDIWYYGVSKKSINQNINQIVVLDILGVKALKNIYGDCVIPILIHVNDDIRKQRAIARGSFDEVEWQRRLIDDRTTFEDKNVRDYICENNNLKSTVIEIENIINNELLGK